MILGITGKCGVGKNTVGNYFEQRGWQMIDIDKTAHKLYRPYLRIWRQVVDRFGEGVLKTNDVIDRQKLRKIVFSNTPEGRKALEYLNAIVHPELERYLKDELYFLRRRERDVVVVGALWKELDMFGFCDKVLLVEAGDALAYERLKKSNAMNFDMYETICMNQQDPPNPDFTVTNEGDLKLLYGQLNRVLEQLKNPA